MGDRSLYYASPIEIPAYEHTVREAERIGMTPEEITEYLKMGEAPPKVWRSFLKEMKLKKEGSKPAKRITKFPVKIKRDAPSRLYPFSEYFLGFEKVGAVRELFGDATERRPPRLQGRVHRQPLPDDIPQRGRRSPDRGERLLQEGSGELALPGRVPLPQPAEGVLRGRGIPGPRGRVRRQPRGLQGLRGHGEGGEEARAGRRQRFWGTFS